jgi:serine/threonine-protein kinase
MPSCPECYAEYGDDVRTCPEHGAELVPSELLVAPDPPLEAGTMIGEYRVERKLGSGTFGDVYAGEQPLIGKRVAIKVLNRRFASEPVIVSRFVAEARAVNKIRQRNIIDIFSFGVVPGIERHYFVMELLDGSTLGEVLDRVGRLPVALAMPLVAGIAAGLDAAHEVGIIHRDLKPDNVFLARERDGSYVPKLLDFGIAKLAGQDVAHKTSSGMVLGTPRYMSPEQARGKATDRRSDIYALGVMIHEMLTGAVLFDADSAVDILLKHAAVDPPPMSTVCKDIPERLDQPVLAMLEKRPDDRPASAGEAVAALVRRAEELGLDRSSVTIDELAASATASGRKAALFSGTTAVVSEPVRDPGSDGAVASRSAPSGRAGHEDTRVSAEGATRRDAGVIPRAAPITESVSTLETPSETMRRGRLRTASIAVIAVVGGSVALAVAFTRSARPEHDASLATAATVVADKATATGDPASAASVSIMLWTKPADVEVWQGAQRLGTSAGPLKLARGTDRVELHLRKEGFADATVSLVPDHDQGIDATLASNAPAKATASAAAAPAGARQAAPAGAGKMDRILGGRD